jgi:glutathione synthase/RimK-type ligase-like ATP-grasp enzyme
MPLKIRLVSNKLGSKSLKLLAEGLSTKLGYKVFRSKKPHPKRENITYGDCKNKIEQYQFFKAQSISALTFTTNYSEAQAWFSQEPKAVVFARHLTRASEGKGIVVVEEAGALPKAPVYTLYKKKKREFRVHIFKDNVVQVLEKRKRKGFEGTVDTKIRNTANGYVFCSQDVVEPPGIRELALKASKVTNSMFKGVDIGFNEKLNELFVIEVNSAPGIQGSNVTKYVEAMVPPGSF